MLLAGASLSAVTITFLLLSWPFLGGEARLKLPCLNGDVALAALHCLLLDVSYADLQHLTIHILELE